MSIFKLIIRLFLPTGRSRALPQKGCHPGGKTESTGPHQAGSTPTTAVGRGRTRTWLPSWTL